MLHTSYIELSKSALKNNLRFLQKHINENTRYSMVIKANAYGHGIEDILPMIEDFGVNHFSVFSAVEAMRANRIKQDKCDIMIMGWISDESMEWAIEHDISFYVFTIDRLKAACEASKKVGKPAKIHIEIETGMHRTGFCREELETVVDVIKNNRKCLEIEGICTHYAGAESINNYNRIQSQIKTFHELCSWVNDHGIHPKYRHTACSAALLIYPETAMDLVRIGISNYGFWPSNEIRMNKIINEYNNQDPLLRVLSWKSEVMSVKTVDEGKYVSYGTSFLTNRKTKIATVPVGYGYGYSRNLSNLGHVLIHGKRVSVIGAVNMNMMVVDATDITDIKEGDEVVLIGNQGDNTITVSSFSDMSNSLNYELLTRLPNHIPRYIVY
ncbi:MAG: alanine racemase [Bacteroidales bacterium]|jgi:alanine racemase|nr:alanine racemase [Bacteroidales bacterium]